MQIKKFEALDMSEALRAVREAMGPDAVILSTREIRKRGGVFGVLSRSVVEVTAAIDPPAVENESGLGTPLAFRAYMENQETAGKPGGKVFPFAEELRELREAVEELRSSNRSGRVGLEPLQEAVAEMKGMLKTLVEQQQRDRPVDLHPNLLSALYRLTAGGVDHRTATDLVQAVKQKLPTDDLWKQDFVQYHLRQLIESMFRLSSPPQAAGEGPGVVALIGPTGVGKTTTIAKLAAQRAQKKGKVSLITMDTDRVGAVEQLKYYARAIGVPVGAAASVGQLREALARRKEGDLILVDTPGRSPFNTGQMEELRELGESGIPMETHLVLSSNTKHSDLCEILDRFSVAPVDRLLFTKMDETRTFGPLLTAMKNKGKPISYLTTGQRVPEDIEAATPKRLAGLIVN